MVNLSLQQFKVARPDAYYQAVAEIEHVRDTLIYYSDSQDPLKKAYLRQAFCGEAGPQLDQALHALTRLHNACTARASPKSTAEHAA